MNFISKQLVCQRYVYKIHSSRLKKEEWRLVLPIDEARRNDEIIALADSQILRWIDELNGVSDTDAKAVEIRKEIKRIKLTESGLGARKQISSLYKALDELQLKSDYLCLIIDKKQDYYRACKGFSVNGVKYKRLLGTNGGIKNSTIVFVSERLHPELSRRIENGRDKGKELVTAKLEAYKALTCSASTPVSLPNGVLVVPDCETSFMTDIVYLSDEDGGEPRMEYIKDYEFVMDASDGYGIMLPSLAERWSSELKLDYTVSGVNTRFSFEKGMVFTFDFLRFAKDVAGQYVVKDAWGNDVDIRNVELILTTSMVKLWDSYKSVDDYITTSLSNGYTFGIAKACPGELESERSLNYQFIQSYDLNDDDIEELISPTIREFKEVLGGDKAKSILFLKGKGLREDEFSKFDDDYIKAMMIDDRICNDPFVRKSIYALIKNKINEAKVGVIKVHGNYSIVSGDPYTLCQSIFGMKLTGLLKPGYIFNKYWADSSADRLACFRAPMTCHNNIRSVKIARDEEALSWYEYMNTCTIFNSWDTTANSLNGCDFDGDLVMLTDNKVLVEKLTPLPSLMCVQRRAEKTIPTEEDFIRSNIESFGNEIGQTTNWITSMFEVRSHYEKGSREYDVLDYRIMCGQLYQQNAIDKAKGIICKPMPRTWHDKYATNKIADADIKDLYRRIAADKKPYFMRYIYPDLMKKYNTYIKNTDKNALREFNMTVAELKAVPENELTPRASEFLSYYEKMLPVGIGDCVMNKICRRFEEEFDGYIGRFNDLSDFDYTFMKSDVEYTRRQYDQIKRLYEDYNSRIKSYSIFAKRERLDSFESVSELNMMNDEFNKECEIVCPDRKMLVNIILDMCYRKNASKRFAWSVCGKDIIDNLLEANSYTFSYPVKDPDGDIDFCGEHFKYLRYKAEVN